MPSGGARARSGPAPDPNALRRDRKDDADWVALPAEGFTGSVPDFPLPKIPVYDIYFSGKERVKEFDADATEAKWESELELWRTLWAKPQAFMWDKLGLQFEVAAYVRAFIRSVSDEGNASDRTAALRMSAEIGLSLPGMHQQRWKFTTDEVGERREARPKSVKDRLRALNE